MLVFTFRLARKQDMVFISYSACILLLFFIVHLARTLILVFKHHAAHKLSMGFMTVTVYVATPAVS